MSGFWYYLHNWFALWGWFFWLLISIEVLILCGAIRSHHGGKAFLSLVGFILFCYLFSDVPSLSWESTRHFFISHRWVILGVVLVEVTGAILWPIKEWKMLGEINKKKLKHIRRLWLLSQGVAGHDLPDDDSPLPEQYKRGWTDYVKGDPSRSILQTEKVKVVHAYELHNRNYYNLDNNFHYFWSEDGDKLANELSRPLRSRDYLSQLCSWSGWWFAYFCIYLFEHFLKELLEKIWKQFKGILDNLMVGWYKEIEQDFVAGETKPDPLPELIDTEV